jgi:hypothetical protein
MISLGKRHFHRHCRQRPVASADFSGFSMAPPWRAHDVFPIVRKVQRRAGSAYE